MKRVQKVLEVGARLVHRVRAAKLVVAEREEGRHRRQHLLVRLKEGALVVRGRALGVGVVAQQQRGVPPGALARRAVRQKSVAHLQLRACAAPRVAKNPQAEEPLVVGRVVQLTGLHVLLVRLRGRLRLQERLRSVQLARARAQGPGREVERAPVALPGRVAAHRIVVSSCRLEVLQMHRVRVRGRPGVGDHAMLAQAPRRVLRRRRHRRGRCRRRPQQQARRGQAPGAPAHRHRA
mmetsp:Transcript_439/g.1540  ORF Transcript_439/g.1540 Transcript_439/m.1540 type:complete len:236 (+) Transcript_439:822-1529(+)